MREFRHLKIETLSCSDFCDYFACFGFWIEDISWQGFPMTELKGWKSSSLRFCLQLLIETETRRDWQVRLYDCNRVFVLLINKLASSSAQHRVDITSGVCRRLDLTQIQRFHNNRTAHVLRCFEQTSCCRNDLIATIMRGVNMNIRIGKIKPDIPKWLFAKQSFLDTPIERGDDRRLDGLQILHALRRIHQTVRGSLFYRSKAPDSLRVITIPIELFCQLIHVLLLADFPNVKEILLDRDTEFFVRRFARAVESIQLIRSLRHALLRTRTLD